MSHWNTKEMIALFKAIEGVTVVRNMGPGGDVDTDNLRLTIAGTDHALFIAGFNVANDPVNKSDTEIEMIEVSDGLDSRGGYNSDSAVHGAVYATVCAKLRELGHVVVPQMKDYF